MEGKKGKRLSVCLGLSIVIYVLIFVLTGASLLAAEKAPIKVGILVPYTGIAPLQAKGVSDGVELAIAEVGQKAGGRAIQVVKEDDEFNPTVGLTKVRRLVEEQKVNFVVGPVSSAVALAIYDGRSGDDPSRGERDSYYPERKRNLSYRRGGNIEGIGTGLGYHCPNSQEIPFLSGGNRRPYR